MELTPEERARWQAFRKQYKKPGAPPERQERIIELSRQGVPALQIQKEVGGAWEYISETRMSARRRGAY